MKKQITFLAIIAVFATLLFSSCSPRHMRGGSGCGYSNLSGFGSGW